MLLRRLLLPPTRSLERDVVTLDVPGEGEVEIQRVRDPRAKRIKLSVDERGARLTLPKRASLVSGERFLHEHREWLATQLAHYAPAADLPNLVRQHSETLPLRGVTMPLHWSEGRYARLTLEHGQLQFQSPAKATDPSLRRTLREFYEAQARADIGRWMPKYLPGLPRAPTRMRLKMMSSQWGSLSPDGSLALDLSLVIAQPSAFEYVLVHELCHLIHANHSAAFWREVETRFPAWRDERAYFHARGRHLKASLRGLLLTD
jgi:predicted metal-dependent hydrolase